MVKTAFADLVKKVIGHTFAEGHGRQIPEHALNSAGHCARAQDERFGGVKTNIDTGKHDIWLVCKQVPEGDIDTICRRAADRPSFDAVRKM